MELESDFFEKVNLVIVLNQSWNRTPSLSSKLFGSKSVHAPWHVSPPHPPLFLQKLKLCKLPNLWCRSELSRYLLAVSVVLNHQLLHLIDSHWELSSQLLCSPWLASRDVHKKDPTFLAQSWSNVSSTRAHLHESFMQYYCLRTVLSKAPSSLPPLRTVLHVARDWI